MKAELAGSFLGSKLFSPETCLGDGSPTLDELLEDGRPFDRMSEDERGLLEDEDDEEGLELDEDDDDDEELLAFASAR